MADDLFERRPWLGDFREVVRWVFFSGRPARKYHAASYLLMFVAIGVGFAAVAPIFSFASHQGKADQASTVIATAAFTSVAFAAALGFMFAVQYKAQLIRTDRRLAHQHTAYYRARLESEFAQKEMRLLAEHAAWEHEREEWQAQKQNELYELILDQVDRGKLGPRPKPLDD
ncbi:hypothetical protein MBT84_19770 [Streptomyces sp. MBT84]|uniref:hypothetical protein n=1 Tax=Streptomyces sp. MBT84 TaxID=1488414 RepID=UPI001C6E2374|nr:hypothetical protein [Streptomyces sp. MBT84]MBW8701848.1 hypothetical protein [Streptomyces sp. MBT84]